MIQRNNTENHKAALLNYYYKKIKQQQPINQETTIKNPTTKPNKQKTKLNKQKTPNKQKPGIFGLAELRENPLHLFR